MMMTQIDYKYMAVQRPLIGIPTWSDNSTVYAGIPLFAINQSYVNAVTRFGALPLLVPLNLPDEMLREIFARLDGLLLCGGTDIDPVYYGQKASNGEGKFDTARDETELKLVRWGLTADLPMLGICRGMQLLNVAAGGTLYHDLAAERPDLGRHDFFSFDRGRRQIRHTVQTTPKSYLRRTLGRSGGVNSMHHQGVRRVGEGLRVTALSHDGLPEGIEAESHPFAVGVQWHPEELTDNPQQARLFADFTAACVRKRLPLAV
ncbi:MAG: gamma-glutamyl-gamma-aminobutyrate hydrolase family protein [Anaerolineales bacterium]|nr:gamma-glutamyl-gamma-aminobutyrate hydrolase family protein [Anaerolineales bacterium]